MKINADFDQRVVLHSGDMEWQDSPMPGVSRRPLDRVGAEVARATSIVRYAPGSHFSPHVHTGGEEFLVLEGVFQDEHGDFPVGSYIRNPPQSSHTPGSEEGCVIFVKLWQFDPQDRIHVRLNSSYTQAVPHKGFDGIEVTPLYKDQFEQVEIRHLSANKEVSLDASDGVEILVLEGELIESEDRLVNGSWLRLPVDTHSTAKSGPDGVRFWIKSGHLRTVDEQIDRVANAG